MRSITRTLALFLAFAAAVPLLAQSLTGTVTGTVTDEQGGALPGVTLTLTGKTGAKTTTSGTDGSYRFVGLDPGSYSVQTSMPNFAARRQDNVIVTVGKEAAIDFALKVGGLAESVDVLAEAPVVDTTSSATNNNLSQDLLFNMPIRQGNTATNLLNFAPGINDSAAYGGDASSGNGLLIDGVDTRDPSGGTAWTFYNYNIVQEVQFTGIGAPAEYGAFTGAVVNTITKSGGNQWSGLFDVIYTKSSFASKNVPGEYIAENPNLAQSAKTEKLVDFTTQLSGPIIQDKLFFFASAQRYQKDDDPIGPRTRLNEASDRFNGKLTWQPSSNDNVAAHIQFDNFNIIGRAGYQALTDSDDITNREDAPEFVWVASWRHLFGSKTFTEVKYTGWWGFFDLNPETLYDADPETQPGRIDENGARYGSQGYAYYADRGRHQAQRLGLPLRRGFRPPRPQVRRGGGAQQDTRPQHLPPQRRLLLRLRRRALPGLQLQLRLRGPQPPRVGVRPGLVEGQRPPDPEPGPAPRPRRRQTSGRRQRLHEHEHRPPLRLRLRRDRRQQDGGEGQLQPVLRGDLQRHLQAGHSGSGRLHHVRRQRLPAVPWHLRPRGAGRDRPGSGGVYGIDPDIKHPRVDETSLGLERALTNDVRLSVTGIYRNNTNLVGSVNPAARWTPTTATNGLGQPMQLYRWANPGDSETTQVITNPDGFQFRDPNGNVLGTVDATKKYKALMIVASKRFTDRWQAQVSYVLSKSYGTIDNTSEGSFGANSSTNGGGGTRQYETPNVILVNSDGELTNSRRHELKLMFGAQIPKIEVGFNAYFRVAQRPAVHAFRAVRLGRHQLPAHVRRPPRAPGAAREPQA